MNVTNRFKYLNDLDQETEKFLIYLSLKIKIFINAYDHYNSKTNNKIFTKKQFYNKSNFDSFSYGMQNQLPSLEFRR